MENGKQGVTFQEFSTAQFASSGPAIDESEPFNGFELLWYSVRIQCAQTRSRYANADKARTRALKLRHAVLTDTPLDRQVRDEVVEIANDAEILAEQQEALPMLPPASVNQDEKFVRFSDHAETQQFSSVPMKQCELGSAHELRLNAFESRVASAKTSSHAVNASDALDRAWSLQREVEMQGKEVSRAGAQAVLEQGEPWLVIDEELLDGPTCAESNGSSSKLQQKPIKKCFWRLDTRGVQNEVRSKCEGKRWQDNVRQCAAIF
eukprot:TRINITY_DN10220_c0_g2_i2.p1 TRINITY_DN10220_c0_g2~~TRINITY_DN10220_c0_g2_i2.p1  ORF type:complete len:264 (-),score=53.79 TRINITY_DN10220_c0_g2_i2:285-1076(-)